MCDVCRDRRSQGRCGECTVSAAVVGCRLREMKRQRVHRIQTGGRPSFTGTIAVLRSVWPREEPLQIVSLPQYTRCLVMPLTCSDLRNLDITSWLSAT